MNRIIIFLFLLFNVCLFGSDDKLNSQVMYTINNKQDLKTNDNILKTKIFSFDDPSELGKVVTQFIQNKEIVDIQFLVSQDIKYSVLIIYRR